MRKHKTLHITLAASLLLAPECGVAQTHESHLPFSRRVASLAPSYLATAIHRVDAENPQAEKGSVLVIFRTTDQGGIMDVRVSGGSPELRDAAVAAAKQWRFRPASFNGQPAEVYSALEFDFSKNPVLVGLPKPMSWEQLSPVLGSKCGNALLQQDPGSVKSCKRQMETASNDSKSTPMERFTAHDEYGLALLLYANNAKDAMVQFDQAIQLAPDGLKPIDAEFAYAYWHRAAAEQEQGRLAAAEHDFITAEDSLVQARQAVENPRIASYYEGLMKAVVQQHASLLENENRHADAQKLLGQGK